MNDAILRQLETQDQTELSRFFRQIRVDLPGRGHFHPHDFGDTTAASICTGAADRKDVYFVAVREEQFVGYGMLRGWDEGYDIPTFGVYVLREWRGTGLGRRLLRFAVETATAMGAPEIMLKVDSSNPRARNLYDSIGFQFEGVGDRPGQLVGRLRLTSSESGTGSVR